MVTLAEVKKSLGIVGDYQDDLIQNYMKEIIDFIKKAGVAETAITAGLVARGISDIWNYGAGQGKLSEYFIWRVSQLAIH